MFIILEHIIKSGYQYILLAVLANTFSCATIGFQDERRHLAPHHETSSTSTLISRESDKPNPLELDLAEEELENDDSPKQALSPLHDITLSYSFHEEQFFAQQAYQSASVEYQKLSYDEHPSKKATFKSEPEYEIESSSTSESESAILTVEEARETMQNIQYAALLGSITDISFEERRQLNTWIIFNKVQFIFEQSHAINQNVNYGPL